MARYQFSPEDCSKGGRTTAQRYDMSERARRGLQALADRYFHGDTKQAGYALSRIGNWTTDPVPENGAFMLPTWMPRALRERIGAPVPDYGDIPF
jgi:hypothetical protein